MTPALSTGVSDLPFAPTAIVGDFYRTMQSYRLREPEKKEDTSIEESRITRRTRAFLVEHPGRRRAIADLIRFDLALADEVKEAIHEILLTASQVNVHDRVSLTADLLVLLQIDLVRYLDDIGVRTNLSGLLLLDIDSQYAVLRAMARNASSVEVRTIVEASRFGPPATCEAALDAIVRLEDSSLAVSLLSRGLADESNKLRRLAREYLDELLEEE